MAVSLLNGDVLDLCIGKPALRPLPISATLGDALLALKRCGEPCLIVWAPECCSLDKKAWVGKICMVDVICHLCSEEYIESPATALEAPVSAIIPKGSAAAVRHVEPHSSILEALDLILDGAQNLVVPIRRGAGSAACKKLGGRGESDYCWLTQEDFVRFFINSIAIFSPLPALSIAELDLVRPDPPAVHLRDSALSALPHLRRALADQTSVAVLDDAGRLVGEISPSTLAHCGEASAAALAALSAGELMAYLDCCSGAYLPEGAVRSLRARLHEKKLDGLLELLENDFSPPFSSSSSSSSTSGSSSSSSDEESITEEKPRRQLRKKPSMGSYSARMGMRAEEAIVCHPRSSLVAVMVQALAHRVGYVWVVDGEDYGLVGIVAFRDVLSVFRDQLQQPSS